MTLLLYKLGIQFYNLLLWTSAPFHPKAKLWVHGRKDFFTGMAQKVSGNQAPVVWFHCASLGEFEQGRPVMEQIKQDYPGYKIALTFFSPSGYEIRKNYSGADYIFYLPLDTPANAQQFIALLKPKLAIFVKYEFWYYYLAELHQQQIPVISIAAIFRENQLFFQPYGAFYRNILKLFTHLFTQDPESANLLLTHGIKQVSVAGDTRFDRVLQNAKAAKDIPIVEKFKNKEPIMVIGSSWLADLRILLPFIQENLHKLKFIIAPHEINQSEMKEMLVQFSGKATRYSQASLENVQDYRILMIDNIGLLASLYQYGSYAYIGGAFGKGLHNTLEAAVFGLPLFFGPVYTKFREAVDLVKLGCAFPVKNTGELHQQFERIFSDEIEQQRITKTASQYVIQQAGATSKIMAACEQWLPKTA
ncbi:3-deoxy-D-manno-octulosonic acid transferase [Adhaeribacter pallidiroseus]|uniref:3-deoxy-D-manno-octulosonic acid transferase n=1 Tax=Adhaeribacter pallidiroseus TaxID=2072847 RepID=A0A369QF38_9BACT|nr:glycosyltransferase N-terminal domain-containing protein [Adhaeribacter pallidiroseus]RDC63521.1 Lipid IV(A) 3-deoxy-D-manno-octulosonic acid transferase [Adhaeribacter pallidiroseus]